MYRWGEIVFEILKVVFRGNVRCISSGVLEIPAELLKEGNASFSIATAPGNPCWRSAK